MVFRLVGRRISLLEQETITFKVIWLVAKVTGNCSLLVNPQPGIPAKMGTWWSAGTPAEILLISAATT